MSISVGGPKNSAKIASSSRPISSRSSGSLIVVPPSSAAAESAVGSRGGRVDRTRALDAMGGAIGDGRRVRGLGAVQVVQARRAAGGPGLDRPLRILGQKAGRSEERR